MIASKHKNLGRTPSKLQLKQAALHASLTPTLRHSIKIGALAIAVAAGPTLLPKAITQGAGAAWACTGIDVTQPISVSGQTCELQDLNITPQTPYDIGLLADLGADVTLSGTENRISTTAYASAIMVNGGTITLEANTILNTTQNGSFGIYAGGTVDTPSNVLLGSGVELDITTQGRWANGLDVYDYSHIGATVTGTTSVHATAETRIATSGEGAHAIRTSTYEGTTNVTVDTSQLYATGYGSSLVNMTSYGSDQNLTINSDLTHQAESAAAIQIDDFGYGQLVNSVVNVNADILSTGANSHAIRGNANYGSLTVKVSGADVEATNADGLGLDAIHVYAMDPSDTLRVNIENGSSIRGDQFAIFTSGATSHINASDSAIEGRSGTAIANYNGVAHVDLERVNLYGNIDLGSGDDTLRLADVSQNGITAIDGGAGHDELTLAFQDNNIETLADNRYLNFEQITITGSGNNSYAEYHVETGGRLETQTLILGSENAKGAALYLHGASELSAEQIIGNADQYGTRSLLTDNRNGTHTITSDLSGELDLTVQTGQKILEADNSYTGNTIISGAGTALYVMGDQTAATGTTRVSTGAILGGTGVIGGDVIIDADARLSGGAMDEVTGINLIGNLTINGDLTTYSGANLDFQFDTVNGQTVHDSLTIGGNLDLQGATYVHLDTSAGLRNGIYTLITYQGDGINLNNLFLAPQSGSYDLFLDTASDHKVELVNSTGVTLAQNTGTDLDALNSADQNKFTIFTTENPDINILNSDADTPLVSSGLQFMQGGTLNGGIIELMDGQTAGETEIRVGSGNAADSGLVATISSTITGENALVKTGDGTLVLTGENSYGGGTQIAEGNLQLGDGGETGSVVGPIAIDAGTSLILNRSNALTLASPISGEGALIQRGTGTTTLTGTHSYTGGTIIEDGTLRLGDGTTNGLISGNVTFAPAQAAPFSIALFALPPATPPVLEFNTTAPQEYAGDITGAGSVVKQGGGTLTLTGTSNYTGGTQIHNGTLQLGNGGTTGSITGDVLTDVGGTLAFNRSDSYVFAGVVSGAGSLAQQGTGTTILTGQNTYTGGTGIHAGTLQVGNGGTTGSITGPVNIGENARLVFNRSDVVHQQVILEGDGTLEQIGSGTTILTGTHVHTGGTFIRNGALQLGTGTENGMIHDDHSIVLAQAAGASEPKLIFNNLTETTFSGEISGYGHVEQNGAGATVLTGENSYYGTTSINAGALQLGDGGETGSIRSDVSIAQGAKLVFNRSNEYIYSGVISGAGRVEQAGSGTTILTGQNTYTGGTRILDGVLQLGADYGSDGSDYGSIVGDVYINDDAALRVENALSTWLNGTISGAGRLEHTGEGATFLTGTNSYTGGTLIENGALVLGFGNGTTGSIVGDIEIGEAGELGFWRSNELVLNGRITGDGEITQGGSGTTILTANNAAEGETLPVDSFTGQTRITAGTLQLGNGGTTGSLGGDIEVEEDGTLVFDRSTDLEYAGVLSGDGYVVKRNTNNLTLSQTTDDYAFAGNIDVEAGTLTVDSLLDSYIAVYEGATLSGTGETWNLYNEGLVTPGGDAIGTFTVNNDYYGENGQLQIQTDVVDGQTVTDRLVIWDDAYGTTTVVVSAADRGGLSNTALVNHQIIQIDGDNDADFILAGDYVQNGDQSFAIGAHSFRVIEGPAGESNDGNIYLSNMTDSGEANYQPGTPVYEGLVHNLQAISELGTLQQRVNGRSWAQGADHTGAHANGFWGRITGSAQRPSNAFSTTGAELKTDLWKTQLGADVSLIDNGEGTALVLGVMGYYGKSETRVGSYFGNGEIETRAMGIGGTLTWYDASGFYADVQAQYSGFESTLDSSILGRLGKNISGTGKSASLELGYAIKLGEKLTLTPQLQNSWSKVSFNSFIDPVGAAISADQGSTVITRGGLMLNHTNSWTSAAGNARAFSTYLVGNVSYDWKDGAKIDVSGTSIANRTHRVWGELGLGASYQLGRNVNFYVEGSGRSSFKDFGDSYGISGVAGVKIGF